jgi:phosphoribosyl 1,2-cyclic phosphodiesterase
LQRALSPVRRKTVGENMRCRTLMSGSSGNAAYFESVSTRLLVDGGKPGVQITRALAAYCHVSAAELEALLVTHAHRDHVLGVGVLARRYKLPVYATEGTWFEMKPVVGDIPKYLRRVIGTDDRLRIGDLEIETFETTHDALESIGYIIGDGSGKVGLVTDTGVFTEKMAGRLQQLDGIILEANHDLDLLRKSRYPPDLKKRISGVQGHLSNEDAAGALAKIAGPQIRQVLLAHLSEENNTEETALAALRECLSERLIKERVSLSVAPRHGASRWIAV